MIIFLAFFLAGETLASLWKPVYSHVLERLVFHTLLGLIAVALVTTGLAFVGGIYPATGWILLGIIFLASMEIWAGLPTLLKPLRPVSSLLPKQDRSFQGINILILATLVLMALLLAMAPPIKTDALVYHLAIPKAYLENHGIINLPNSVYSFFPMLFDMVFLFAMTFGVESLPALLGLGMALLLLAGLAIYFHQTLSPRLAWFVPVLFFSTPTFFEIAASAYIDLALAGFIFFAFYSWDRWRETHLPFWFFYMAVCAGAACSTKLTGLIVLPLGVMGIALMGLNVKIPLKVFKHLLIFSGIALLFLMPWWLRNYQFTGNPFMPLLMPILGGENRVNWDPGRMAMFDHYVGMFGMGRGILDFLLLPYNLTFHAKAHSLKFDGQVGIVYFMLIPALIMAGWRNRPPRWKFLSGLFAVLILFWFVYFQYVRFLAPALTALTLLGALALASITRRDPESPKSNRWLGPIFLCVVTFGVLFNVSLIWDFWTQKAPYQFVTGQETRKQYLTRHIPPYPMYQAMNALEPDSKTLMVYMRNLGYLAERPFYNDSVFEAHTLQAILEQDASANGIRRQLQELGITHFMFDRGFLFGQGGALPPEDQAALGKFLKRRGKLLQHKGAFQLYELVLD